MHNYIKLLAVVTVLVSFGLLAPAEQAFSQSQERGPEPSAPAAPEEPSFAPDRILVKTKENASTEAVESVNRKNDAHTAKKIRGTRVNVVKLPKELPVEEAVERYEASPDVEYAEPDYKVYPTQSSPTPNDPRYGTLYGLNNSGQNDGIADADVDAPEAWSVTAGDASTIVAVIDTGIDTKHPDLKNNIWVNPGEVAGNGVDDDRNGYVDDVNGYDFANDDASVFDTAVDDRHGTHVAGTVAGEGNNSLGMVGVNWQAKVMSAKFIGPDDVGYISDAVEALNYAVANGAKISNNSWALSPFSRTLFDTIKAADSKGHLFVAAAMNNARDNDVTPTYPAGYDSPNIISVAATDNKDALASFSNYGSSSVDLAAPGVGILSTVPGSSYSYGNGTSMATPHVTGVAALLKSNSPNLGVAEIKERILSSVDSKANLEGKTVTGGRLNAARALGVPMVDSTTPASEATGVARNLNIEAAFTEDMKLDTIDTSTVTLQQKYRYQIKKKRNGKVRRVWTYRWVPVSAAVSYDADTKTATLDPSSDLAASTTYRALVNTGVSANEDTPLAENYSWTFTTGST